MSKIEHYFEKESDLKIDVIKIYLILYPSLEKSTTGIAIAHLNLHDRIQALEIQIFIAKLTIGILIRFFEEFRPGKK